MEKPLKIYSASAGSGKTYTLVKTYLELILKGDANPQNFSKIIAMTFTNKAALEMKTRIVSALDQLSNPNRVPELSKKAFSYQQTIAQEFEMSVENLQRKAQEALQHILHQYEDFFVMTIDKFNLRLIRSFAMDLNLDANFKVVIDETEITTRVLDDFLDSFDQSTSNLLSKIFLSLAQENVDEGNNWNFERELREYIDILKKEEAIDLLDQIPTEELSFETFKEIKSMIPLIEHQIVGIGSKYVEQIDSLISTIDNKTKARTFHNLVAKSRNNPDELLKKSIFSDAQIRYLENGDLPAELEGVCLRFLKEHGNLVGQLEGLQKIKKSFHYIHLLKKINDRLKEYRQTEQIIRISEFNRMISDLLRNESSPFIYEKLGTRFNHFLLDEFQDTSRLQWQNIVPLVHESISQNNLNLIVGDPKQSIYRFRGGIADQFVSLPAIYNPKNDAHINALSSYFESMGSKNNLGANYRSSKEIVQFNNQLFIELVAFLIDSENLDYSQYYDRLEQEPKNEQIGYVEIQSIADTKRKKASSTSEEDTSSEEESSPENIQFLITSVNKCIEDGYDKGDICILGDTSKLCNQYALELTRQGHKVVSSDSLSVDSDQLVKLAILYLSWRNQPSNNLLAKRFAEKYLFLKDSETAISTYLKYFAVAENGRISKVFESRKFIEDHFESWENFHFPFENLYALLERFYQITQLSELTNPYLHHLSDLAFDFDLNNGPDLSAFLDFYTKSGFKSSIQTPENKDAIKIMTAHKSKGLEFKVVIIPQLNNSFLKSKSKYLTPIDNRIAYSELSSNHQNEELSQHYQEEKKASLLDKLNLYYVAFTRPIDRLYVYNLILKNSKTHFGNIFHNFLLSGQSKFDLQIEELENQRQEITLKLGQEVKTNQKRDEEILPEFIPTNVADKLWFPSISLKNHLEEIEEGIDEQRRYGKQLHLVLSEINDANSITTIVDEFIRKGWIEHPFRNRMLVDLENLFTNEEYQQLHANLTQVINEQSIIISAEDVKRPDKIILKENETIVLDYKTGLEKKQDLKQVKEYCAILSSMNYPNVKGVVLYTQQLRFVYL